jgi:hypothetical protein
MVRRGATLGAGLFASVVAPSAVRAGLMLCSRNAEREGFWFLQSYAGPRRG